MHQDRALGETLRDLRHRYGFESAASLAKKAGLSTNYVSILERGEIYPRPKTVRLLADAIGLRDEERSRFLRLAGVSEDPAASPRAQGLRRDSWRPLTYILANHILLPRLALLEMVKPRKGKPPPAGELLAKAAAATGIAAFCRETAGITKPPAPLVRDIESEFNYLTPPLLENLQSEISAAGADAFSRSHETEKLVPPYLFGLCRPHQTDFELYASLVWGRLDRSFGVCVFPALYWHSCRLWPFDKVVIPYARLSVDGQRMLYEAIRGGLDVKTFDLALLGCGELGEALRGHAPLRPLSETSSDRRSHGEVCFILQEDDYSIRYRGPEPPHDCFFDHLDRCGFLSQFPLLKIDQDGAGQTAGSLDLPSWEIWTQEIRKRWVTIRYDQYGNEDEGGVPPDDAAPGPSRRFAAVSWSVIPAGDGLSGAGQALAEELQSLVGNSVCYGHWVRLMEAARLLGLAKPWTEILEALAKAQGRLARFKVPPGKWEPTVQDVPRPHDDGSAAAGTP